VARSRTPWRQSTLPGWLRKRQANGKYKAIQISLNNVARSITGSRRNDRTHVVNLLETARLPSVNSMTVSAVAMEAWHAYRSNDGSNGARNPIGSMVFDSREQHVRARTVKCLFC
jgi:hypothetical protein